MASIRGILNIQSLNDSSRPRISENPDTSPPLSRRGVGPPTSICFDSVDGSGLGGFVFVEVLNVVTAPLRRGGPTVSLWEIVVTLFSVF